MRHRLGQRNALVLDHFGHPRSAEGIDQHERGDDRQRRADDAACRLQQQHHADDRRGEVHGRRLSGPRRELAIEQEKIGTAKGRGEREHPVLCRDAVAR